MSSTRPKAPRPVPRPAAPPRAAPSPTTKRCSAAEGSRRCARNGTGRPALCRLHRLALEENPIDQLWDRVDETLDGTTDRLIHGIQGLFERLADRIQRPPDGAPARAAPPPPPPRRIEVEEIDPRTVLGFPAGLKLTRELVKKRQRELATILHPDRGGSDAAQQRLNAAAKKLLDSLK